MTDEIVSLYIISIKQYHFYIHLQYRVLTVFFSLSIGQIDVSYFMFICLRAAEHT